MKYCPHCGAGVEPDAASCESCGASLAACRRRWPRPWGSPDARRRTASTGTVTDLTPQQLRREIRWGVFQGILLVAVIVFFVYLVIFLVIVSASGSVAGISG